MALESVVSGAALSTTFASPKALPATPATSRHPMHRFPMLSIDMTHLVTFNTTVPPVVIVSTPYGFLMLRRKLRTVAQIRQEVT